MTEQILFKNVIKRGFWPRKTEWVLEVANEGIVMENEQGQVTRLPYSELVDCLIMNQHSTRYGYHYTFSNGHYPNRNYWV